VKVQQILQLHSPQLVLMWVLMVENQTSAALGMRNFSVVPHEEILEAPVFLVYFIDIRVAILLPHGIRVTAITIEALLQKRIVLIYRAIDMLVHVDVGIVHGMAHGIGMRR